MKNIKIILICLIVGILGSSCDTDGGTSEIDLIEAAVSDIQKVDGFPGILNLNQLNAGEEVEISFRVDIATGDVSSADVIGFYRTATGELYGPVTLESSISTFPQEVKLSGSDIVAAFAELSSTDDFELADELILSTRLYMADGRVLDLLDENGARLYGSNVHTANLWNAQVSYPVSCPSDLGGTYNVISNGTSTEPGVPPADDLEYTVTVTDNGGGSYTISDGVAGVYIYWYTGFGYTFETPGSFTDICGTLSGSWTEGFGCQVDLTGTVNDDGTLSIHWENCFGDSVDAVYIPQ